MMTLETSLAFRIHRLQRLLRRHFLRESERHGYRLTPEQFFLLDKLSRMDGQPQSALADEALQDRPNLTRMLREMEKHGWLVRRRDPSDARRRLVHLTRAGAELLEGFHAEVVGPAREQLFSGLDEALIESCHAVLDHLEERVT